jgi:hypothetical protein
VEFLTVKNLTRNVTLGNRVRLAGTSAARRRGLLGVVELAAGEGLWIAPCEVIHTIGMKIAIDVVFLSKDCRVSKIKPRLGGWRFSMCLPAHSVLELREGTLKGSGTERGDQLSIFATEP